MDTQGDAYYMNLLNGQSNFDHGFTIEFLDEENQYVPTSPQLGSTTKKTQRGGNFTVDEDILLISAWLNISLDPVQGNEQKAKKYWLWVWEYFNEHRTFDSNRNQGSLMNRWSAIQLATNKFAGCFSQIERLNQSGTNDKDKVRDAKKMYKELYTSPFPFEHCWNELRYQPKWMEESEIKKQKTKKNTTAGSSSCKPTTINLEDMNETHGLKHVELERPPGRKAEKERQNKRKRKLGGNDSTSSSMVELLEDMREERRAMNEVKKTMLEKAYLQEEAKIKQKAEVILQNDKLMSMKQLKEEERIMYMDTSRMPPLQAEYSTPPNGNSWEKDIVIDPFFLLE